MTCRYIGTLERDTENHAPSSVITHHEESRLIRPNDFSALLIFQLRYSCARRNRLPIWLSVNLGLRTGRRKEKPNIMHSNAECAQGNVQNIAETCT